MPRSPTRGQGLLEPLLARLRAKKAERHIPDQLRAGSILDIGCGATAPFLRNVAFETKYGIDQLVRPSVDGDVTLKQLDLNAKPRLPFEEASISVITLLAVVEHLLASVVPEIFKEAHRVLRPGGRIIITTPAPWTDPVLRGMARVGLVSSEEIKEHQNVMRRKELVRQLTDAGFRARNIESGYFELGLNMWAAAKK